MAVRDVPGKLAADEKPSGLAQMVDALARKPGWRNLLLAILVSLLIVPLHGRPGIRILEARAFDLLSSLSPPRPAIPSAVVVAIDEPSFAELAERWPWSRATHARLVESLRRAGAKTIGLDIVFAEPSTEEADEALAAALGPETVLAADREVIVMDQATQVSRVGPLQRFLNSGASFGITSVDLDGDGVLRRLPTGLDSFPAALLAARGDPVPTLPSRPLIQYFGGARTYPTFSYYQALDPAAYLPPEVFQGKTVLVGLSLKAAPGTDSGAADAFETPYSIKTGTLTAGVEVHATLLDNLSHGLWITPAPWFVIALAVFVSALAGSGTGAAGRSGRAAALGGMALLAIPLTTYLSLRLGRVWIPPVTPAMAAVGCYFGRLALDYQQERRLRQAVSDAFSRYVTPDLVAELARNPAALKLGGEKREISILFCDVRGFTGLSERLKDDPARLMSIINRLLDALSEQVLVARGTIDKYMGDCVMAFWNAPLPNQDHAKAAVAAALRMEVALNQLNRELQQEDPSLPPLAVGVGVNTGVCVVGNIGSRWRYDYSVLGDAVNLASRLEGLTKTYGRPVIIGEATALAVADTYAIEELDRIAVRGRSAATPIFGVSARAQATDQIIPAG